MFSLAFPSATPKLHLQPESAHEISSLPLRSPWLQLKNGCYRGLKNCSHLATLLDSCLPTSLCLFTAAPVFFYGCCWMCWMMVSRGERGDEAPHFHYRWHSPSSYAFGYLVCREFLDAPRGENRKFGLEAPGTVIFHYKTYMK